MAKMKVIDCIYKQLVKIMRLKEQHGSLLVLYLFPSLFVNMKILVQSNHNQVMEYKYETVGLYFLIVFSSSDCFVFSAVKIACITGRS